MNTLGVACALSIVGLYLLYITNTGDVSIFYIGLSIIGICFGAFMGVFPGLTADQYGPKNNSVNFGIMFANFAVAGYTAPNIMNHVHAATESYKGAFLISIGFCVVGLVLTYMYRIITKRSHASSLAETN